MTVAIPIRPEALEDFEEFEDFDPAPPPVSLSASFSAADLQSMQFEPIKYVVPGCHIVEGLTILASKPKLGKSWLMLQAAIAVSLGEVIFEARCEPGDVLYAALEDNPRRIQSRMDKLCGLRPWPSRLTFRCEMPGLAEGGLDVIRDWAEQVERPRLAIIDVLAKVRPSRGREEGNYEADYKAVSGLKALCDELGIAVVLVHHVRKMEADDPLDTVSGTTGLTGAVDSILVLSRNSDGVTLQGRGRDITEVDAAVKFDREDCRWSYLGEASEVRRSDERNLILDALLQAGEPMSPRDLADATGHPYGAVRRLLVKMSSAGELIKAGRGSYEHPSNSGHKVTTDRDDED